MNFETFFRLISYAAVFCGFLSLWVSGSFGVIASVLFLAVIAAAWFLEGSKWQISEKVGTALIVLALPAFIVSWRFEWISVNNVDTEVAGILARLILSLSAIKLLQHKSSRDWVFLYLMSFFQVMLGAGLSISGLYFLSFLLYVVVIICAIISLEIRKAASEVDKKSHAGTANQVIIIPANRLPVVSLVMIILISLIALPLFFMLPRVGGAGFVGGKNERTRSGFSDTVRLGGIGRIQENEAVVMRVKVEDGSKSEGLYFRGIALDTFDNLSWSRPTSKIRKPFEKGERDSIQLDTPRSRDNLSIQTIYLEPLETNVLFAVPRAVVVQGNFPFLEKDLYDAISFPPTFERVSYKVLSDRSTPPAARLRNDSELYTAEHRNYRQLPEDLDPRIAQLAEQVTAGLSNRYDKAVAIEEFLRTSFGYTLQRKASGPEPLADFLFNVREGHCEYFATAMAVMLRTQGIATRIVNGFRGGEYNDAADITIVREKNAHAWVEVYFPGEDTWITFDPTPAADVNTTGFGDGVAGALRKYGEALETFWIQYFVAFDDQGQRSLARSVRSGMSGFRNAGSAYIDVVKGVLADWWAEVKGAEGGEVRMFAIGRAMAAITGIVLLVFFTKWFAGWLWGLPVWKRLRRGRTDKTAAGIVDFYERMLSVLSERGVQKEPFQTPMEFASSSNVPGAVIITDHYNRVRFGHRDISREEAAEIDGWLRSMKG